MDGSAKANEKQNKAMKKSSGSRTGRQEINSMSELSRLPGVHKQKRKSK